MEDVGRMEVTHGLGNIERCVEDRGVVKARGLNGGVDKALRGGRWMEGGGKEDEVNLSDKEERGVEKIKIRSLL